MPLAPSIVPASVPDFMDRSGLRGPADRKRVLDLPSLPGYPGTPRGDEDQPDPLGPEAAAGPVRTQDALDRGTVLIVSASRTGSAIERTLVRAGLATRRLTTTNEALRETGPRTRAIVLAPPLELLQPETAINVLETPARQVDAPMLVVLDEDTPRRKERSEDLIESGAEQVFTWPRDGLLLAITLATGR